MSKIYNIHTIGTVFRAKREEQGLLIRQVSALADMDQAVISRIENAGRLPTRKQLNRLIHLYGLDPDDTYLEWLTEKIILDYGSDAFALRALRAAHDRLQGGIRASQNRPQGSWDVSED